MLRHWCWFPLLVFSFLAGCTAMDSAVVRSGKFLLLPDHTVDFEFDLTDPTSIQKTNATLNTAYTTDLLLRTRRGSQVALVDDADHRFMGTLLNATATEVELMNCICREVVPGPADQKQCKTSHVPFQSLKTSSLTHFTLISPPARGFPTAADEIDSCDVTVGEIVYRNGRRQAWGKPTE